MTNAIDKLTQYHFGQDHDAPPLIIAHGLFGSARNWRALARNLAQKRPVITVDMRNHGQSFWHSGHTYFDLADDLARLLGAQSQHCDLLGHSMGGKAAMVMALRAPANLGRLIIADIAPVAYFHNHHALIDAMEHLDISTIRRRADADDQLSAVITDRAIRAFLLQSLEITDNRAHWRFNLAALKDNMDDIVGFPTLDSRFDGRTLFLSGEISDYILPAHKEQITRFFPNAVMETIPSAGHWVHAEAPGALISSVQRFLAQ